MKRAALIVQAEGMRFVRQRANLAVLGLLALLLFAGAVASGQSARDWRAEAAQAHRRALAAEAGARAAAPGGEGAAAAMASFQFARSGALPAQAEGLGGLALGTTGFALLGASAQPTVESRHTDARRHERLSNPLLEDLGLPDFATVVALLLPLALLGLAGAMVQELRAQGLWRWMQACGERPACVLAIAIGLRVGSVATVAAAASLLAFALDPGAGLEALLPWLGALAAFVAWWAAAAGLLNLLPVSAGAAMLAGLGLWLATTFAVPAALAAAVDRVALMPSRLAALIAVREAQQQAEAQADALLAAWYVAHPDVRPLQAQHGWPVSFMPRYLAQEQQVRPLMAAFDSQRALRHAWIEAHAWMAPGLGLVMAADRLAGSDAASHARFSAEVDRYEDAWRRFFVPRIMGYRGLAAEDVDTLPRYVPPRR